MIGIINMNTNNINCFIKILKNLGFKHQVINCLNDYNDNIRSLIIPGIGTYKNCITYMKDTGLDICIREHINKKKKILGICIGMQILTDYGDEGGLSPGFGYFKGFNVTLLKTDQILPHIGWSNLSFMKTDSLFNDIDLKCDFYFVHSYNVISTLLDDNNVILANSNYGNTTFIAVKIGRAHV